MTGHVPAGSGTTECDQEVFTVCLSCACCPIDNWGGEGWYCVIDGSFTGTGTSAANCSVLFLTEADRCDEDIVICSGPYATEAEAQVVCPDDTTPGPDCAGATQLVPENAYTVTDAASHGAAQWFKIPVVMGETWYVHVTNGGGIEQLDGSGINYSGDNCTGSSVGFGFSICSCNAPGPVGNCCDSDTITHTGWLFYSLAPSGSVSGSYTIRFTQTVPPGYPGCE